MPKCPNPGCGDLLSEGSYEDHLRCCSHRPDPDRERRRQERWDRLVEEGRAHPRGTRVYVRYPWASPTNAIGTVIGHDDAGSHEVAFDRGGWGHVGGVDHMVPLGLCPHCGKGLPVKNVDLWTDLGLSFVKVDVEPRRRTTLLERVTTWWRGRSRPKG